MRRAARIGVAAALAGWLLACPANEPAAVSESAAPEAPRASAGPPLDEPRVARLRVEDVRARLVAQAAIPAHPSAWGTEGQHALLARASTLRLLAEHRTDDVELLLELARLYRAALFPERSLQLVGLALRAEPDDPRALFEGALGLLDRQEPAAAEALLAGLLERDPRNLPALRERARVLRRLGDAEGARRAAEAGLGVSAFDGDLKLVLGQLALEAGDAAQAEPLLAAAVRALPESLEARYAHASALRELGRFEEADAQAAVHARLARIDDLGLPAGTSAHDRALALAQADLAAGEIERAEAELRALVVERERSPAALALLEELWRARGDDVEARRAELDRD